MEQTGKKDILSSAELGFVSIPAAAAAMEATAVEESAPQLEITSTEWPASWAGAHSSSHASALSRFPLPNSAVPPSPYISQCFPVIFSRSGLRVVVGSGRPELLLGLSSW